MLISDWSSDVCSSDLHDLHTHHHWALIRGTGKRPMVPPHDPRHPANTTSAGAARAAPTQVPPPTGPAPAAPSEAPTPSLDRQSVVSGKGVYVRVKLGGRLII